MEEVVINSGDTAWMLISTGLVVLMIPGLALFYGGMVRVKSVLNMMMMSFGALAIVFVLWIAFGFSMVFGDSVGGKGLIGDIGQFTFLNGLDNSTALIGTIPAAVFIAFQGIFAAIRCADFRINCRSRKVWRMDGLCRNLGNYCVLPSCTLGICL